MAEPEFVKVKSNVECKSGDTKVGKFSNLEQCATAVSEKGGEFFIYGTGSKAGHCYVEHTKSHTCSEGWENDKYDFYKMSAAPNVVKVKSGVECKSNDKGHGKFGTLGMCAAAVAKGGGKFFVYGTGKKAGACYTEYTKSDGCEEGWEKDSYDFYKFEEPKVEEQTQEQAKEQQGEFKAQKMATKGYCSDWKYLPEGGYPPRKNLKADPVQECAQRCHKAYGKPQAIYLRDKDMTCACSKGGCNQITSQKAYTSYKLTEQPAKEKKEAKKQSIPKEAAEALAKEMSNDSTKEAKFKADEKKDETFRKGLFRMGMRFQGLLHQLARSDDSEMAGEIKAECAKLEKKIPKYIINVNEELEKVELRNLKH